MMGLNKIVFETIIISLLNVAAVYVAAFNYKLNWFGVMSVMVIAAGVTALITHFLSAKNVRMNFGMVLPEGVSLLSIAGLSSIAVLVILVNRFNLPEALGIALLSGGATAFLRALIKDL